MSLRLHHWIRKLYLTAAETEPEAFARTALERVTELVPHAASTWQTLDATGNTLARSEYAPAVGLIAEERPASHVAHYPIAEDGNARAHRFVFLRTDAAAAFDAQERRQLEEVVEHLAGAERLHQRVRQIAGSRTAGHGADSGMGVAHVDAAGRLLQADAEFALLMRGANDDWNGRTLPFALPAEVDPAAPGMVHRGLWIMLKREGEGWEVKARRDRRALKLSGRELQIAERVAEGFTFKEIAGDLGVAPSTVSTHLYNLYTKLGIRRRAELIAWLRQYHSPDGTDG